jgi:hypothetical protein
VTLGIADVTLDHLQMRFTGVHRPSRPHRPASVCSGNAHGAKLILREFGATGACFLPYPASPTGREDRRDGQESSPE